MVKMESRRVEKEERRGEVDVNIVSFQPPIFSWSTLPQPNLVANLPTVTAEICDRQPRHSLSLSIPATQALRARHVS